MTLIPFIFIVPAVLMVLLARFKWVSVLAFIVTIITLGLSASISIHWRWVIMVILFIAFSMILGQQVTGKAESNKFTAGPLLGILIDSRFKMSLSRFQIMLWTIMVFSAIAVIALARAADMLPKINENIEKLSQALNIAFPGELLAVLGISTASLAIASLIKSNKSETKSNKTITLLTDQKAAAEKKLEEAKKNEKRVIDLIKQLNEYRAVDQNDPNYASAQLEIDRINKELSPSPDGALKTAQTSSADAQKELDEFNKAEEGAQGDIHANDSIEQADWSDMFRGDLVNNYRVVDVGKVQMFYITILLIFIYGTMIWGLLGTETLLSGEIVNFPDFSDSMVELLGISHAGYLTLKQAGG
jgi:hypothetical protein